MQRPSLMLMLLLLIGCQPVQTFENSPRPTVPNTLPELIEVLNGENAEAKIRAAYVLASIGPEAAPAVEALTANLTYQGPYDVPESAAFALGRIGPAAISATPSLVLLMHDDAAFFRVRSAAALAVGQIGDRTAVPELVEVLYADNLFDESSRKGIAINAALAIELITGKEFGGRSGTAYDMGLNHVPVVVLEARRWWETEGQYQDWSLPPTKIP